MFDDLTPYQKELVFRGLKSLIETNTGIGFHNADQGHMVYCEGAEGIAFIASAKDQPDSPQKNELYKLLHALSADLSKLDSQQFTWWYDFDSWKSFCKLAYESYKKDRKA